MRKRNEGRALELGIVPAAFRVKEVAAYLAVGETAIYDLLNMGELTQLKIGKSLLIPKTSVDALLDRASKRNSLPKAG